MTILKNIVLIAALSLGIPLNTYTYQTMIEINADITTNTIIYYMPLLRQQATPSANKVVQWLDKQLQEQSLNKYDALTIANILDEPATIDTKIAKILQIIAIKERAQSKLQFKQFIDTLFACGVGIACFIAIVSAAANPHRPICPNSITTTYKFNDNFSVTFSNKQQPILYSYSIFPNPLYEITYQI